MLKDTEICCYAVERYYSALCRAAVATSADAASAGYLRDADKRGRQPPLRY